MNNKHVLVRRNPRPRPLDHEFPENEQEQQMLDAWQIGIVEDLVDDSVQYIREELSNLGISPHKASEIAERIQVNVFPVWATRVLYGCCEHLEPEGTDEFLFKKFGISGNT